MMIPARTATAVVLLVGFHVLAIGLVGALLVPLIWSVEQATFVHAALALIGLTLAVLVLLPFLRPGRASEPPGFDLDRIDHPRLFELLDELVRRLDVRRPDMLRLTGEVNARIYERRESLLRPSRKILAIGLPLLQGLQVREVAGVVAHELAHLKAGDPSISPLFSYTQRVMHRLLSTLETPGISAPFLWYGQLFLKVTSAQARRQELAADAAAARCVGVDPLLTGLQRVRPLSVAYHAFLQEEWFPTLERGFRAPLAAGFGLFLEQETTHALLRDARREALAEEDDDPYASHPPPSRRLLQLEELRRHGRAGDEVGPDEDEGSAEPGTTLLRRIDDMEAILCRALLGEGIDELSPGRWEVEVLENRLWVFRGAVAAHRETYLGLTIDDVPSFLGDDELAARLVPRPGEWLGDEERIERATNLLGALVILALRERDDWTLRRDPGANVIATRDGHEVDPFRLVHTVRRESWPPDRWSAFLAEHDLGPLDLPDALDRCRPPSLPGGGHPLEGH